MPNVPNDLAVIFRKAAEDEQIVRARLAVLDSCSVVFTRLADLLQTSGWIGRDRKELAAALLMRLASELAGGISLLIQNSHLYAAGALLRQLIEIEYLLFLGYANPTTLQNWYEADATELRKLFSPQQMRKRTDGLFRDKEYWLHCEIGGHPHPMGSRVLLSSSYTTPVPAVAFLLPDTVQHLRRLWTSVKLLLPKLNIGEIALNESGQRLSEAIAHWETIENPTVLSYDGIPG
jgi:hypothetical protein